MAAALNYGPVIEQLKAKAAEVLDRLINKNSHCALLDFPNYSNVGDSLIWLGELNYLKSRNVNIRYCCDINNYRRQALQKAVGESGTILLSGGGNFGDLYPAHQRFRERIIKEFPRCKIIQLPQSIHFREMENLARFRSCVMAHDDFHLCVRDRAGVITAAENFSCPVYLCPDMAFFVNPPPWKHTGNSTGVVVLSRTDFEKQDPFYFQPIDVQNKIRISDWLDEDVAPRAETLFRWTQQRLSWPSSKFPNRGLNRLALFATASMAESRMSRGIAILGEGEAVVTDRLHAMILSLLGNKRTYYADNANGKLSAFAAAWLNKQQYPKRFPSLDAALRRAVDELEH